MKIKLNTTIAFSILLIAAFSQMSFAQQGALDPSFNNDGQHYAIFQETLPAPIPAGAPSGYINSYYSTGDAYADGRVIVSGGISSSTSNNSYLTDFFLRRLLPNGSVDTSFGGGYVQTQFYNLANTSDFGGRTNTLGAIAKIQPLDGKVVVVAQCVIPDTTLGTDVCLVRYNQDGTLDTSFGGAPVVVNFHTGPPQTFQIDPGKVFTQTGTNSYDNSSYGSFGGKPNDLKIGADGRIYVFGSSADYLPTGIGISPSVARPKGFVAVYSTNGTLQNIYSFYDETGSATDGGDFGTVRINGGEVLSNGNFIAVGVKQHRTTGTNYTAAKWTIWTNGTPNGIYLDNGNGHAQERALTVKLLRSNKILVGGAYGSTSQFNENQAALVRYNSDLSLDTTFGTGGIISYDGTFREPNHVYLYSHSVAYITGIQNDGKIIVADSGIWRYNPDGSPDHSFGLGLADPNHDYNFGFVRDGSYISPFPIKDGRTVGFNFGYPFLKPNGRIVTAGCIACGFDGASLPRGIASQLISYPRNGIYNDFDNDGKSDVSVYRPGEGVWYQLSSFNNAFGGTQFGTASDKIAPADYDGDGRTDQAVYRPSEGVWYIRQSSNNQVRYVNFGSNGDLPRPGDFNGDGYADIAVFRPSTGVWYILYSNPVQPGNTTFATVQFGQSGDVPMLADFDGDGKTDIAVWRPSNGVWYWIRSTDNQFQSAQFGTNGDIPINGDFDGDGKADLAVYRPSTGTWYIARTTTGTPSQNFDTVKFGLSNDIPVAADYDNDGKNDIAVYRPSTG
ncbi:MAG: FG-GAP-like repeat-containing protein, partial [Acidobacteriota bacterium]|nr:FG-GAP-like repeat-containing protein [Acidobacteriota bacterium]